MLVFSFVSSFIKGEDGLLLAKGQLEEAVKDLSQYDVSNINDQRLLSGE